MATVYPKGIVMFQPHDNAPSFVKGVVKIDVNQLVTFCKENADYLVDYKGNKQLPLQLLEGDKGMYFTVDTFKPKQGGGAGNNPIDESELPF